MYTAPMRQASDTPGLGMPDSETWMQHSFEISEPQGSAGGTELCGLDCKNLGTRHRRKHGVHICAGAKEITGGWI